MRRLYRTVAWIALVARAWPSLGALPWLAQPAQALAARHNHAHVSQPHHHVDPSTIPGSPTHPDITTVSSVRCCSTWRAAYFPHLPSESFHPSSPATLHPASRSP